MSSTLALEAPTSALPVHDEAATAGALDRRLLQLGTALFLLGLLTGLVVPLAANPRMALSSHLEGVLNGLLLLVLGLLWTRLRLGARSRRWLFGLAVYGTFANWGTTLGAALWAAGESMMPLAAAGHTGTSGQEMLIAAGLLSLSLAMLVVCPLLLWGLRGTSEPGGIPRALPARHPHQPDRP